MTDNSIRELLKKLHHTLDGSPSIAPADRALLKQLSADIQSVLARPGAPAAGSHQTLIDRLQAAVTHFEVSHPDLTATMSQAAKTLGDMGI
jgi:hypothetical protein